MTPVRKSPETTNPDRKCARERLSRYDIAKANCEAGDEGEIDCVAERPALKKTNQQAQHNLKCWYCRQHRPREMDCAARGNEKASPY